MTAREPWEPALSTCLVRGLAGEAPPWFKPARHLPLFVEAGFRCIELCCYLEGDFDGRTPAALRELQARCNDLGVEIHAVHAPETRDLLSPDRTAREAAMACVREFCAICARLGSRRLTLHFWSVDEPLHAMGRRPAGMLARLAEAGREAGVSVNIETLRSPPSRIANAALLSLLAAPEAEGVGLVIDTGHSHISGDLDGYAVRAGSRLAGLHIQDNNGRDDQHRLPGEGSIDWRRFAEDLRTAGYAGPLLLEVGAPAADVSLNTCLGRCRESLRLLVGT